MGNLSESSPIRLKNIVEKDLSWPQDPEARSVISILNFFEEMAISVNEGLADERMLGLYFGTTIKRCYALSQPVVTELRTRTGNPAVYKSIERLIGAWTFSDINQD
jgi:hypothetical protein